MQQVFLEYKLVALSGYTAGHMYLVSRDVAVVGEDIKQADDQVIRGSDDGVLGTYVGLLADSLDDYNRDSVTLRSSINITDQIPGGRQARACCLLQ